MYIKKKYSTTREGEEDLRIYGYTIEDCNEYLGSKIKRETLSEENSIKKIQAA